VSHAKHNRLPSIHMRRALWRCRSLMAVAIGLAATAAIPGCHDENHFGCRGGQYCACGNGPDCFIECPADACNLECSHTTHACGAICGNGCVASCHDTGECSDSCGDSCTLECHSVDSCAAQCGANCSYTCHDATKCGVHVGPNSSVDCHSLASCAVECTGPCSVICTDVSDSCTVTCAPGFSQSTNGNGTITCG
jgi:hypothetical protein